MTYYRFYLTINDDEPLQCYPIYKELSVNYARESGGMYFRQKLNGSITFSGNDFDEITAAAFSSTFTISVEVARSRNEQYTEVAKAKFSITDCEIDYDDKKLSVTPQPCDEYDNVISGLDKEFDLIKLAPKIERCVIRKRPLLQVYLPGSDIVSCFLGGTYWEQNVQEVSDINTLINTYHFAYNSHYVEIELEGSATPNVANLYAGTIPNDTTYPFTATLASADGSYTLLVERKAVNNPVDGYDLSTTIDIVDNTNTLLFWYHHLDEEGAQTMQFPYTFEGRTYTFTPYGSSTGAVSGDAVDYKVFARYILDKDNVAGLQAYPLSSNDLVSDNRNYHYVVGYGVSVVKLSMRNSATPTEYGLNDDNRYYLPPASISGQTFYPVARSMWRNASLWYDSLVNDEVIERKGRQSYILRDAYPIDGVIAVLLGEIAPDVTHEGTSQYSAFLYSDENPISHNFFRLLLTQKSNILAGEYQQPAQKAPVTLGSVLDMLRNAYNLYWHIDNGKLRIEHISWYRNGGSYSGAATMWLDLRSLINVRNGHAYTFAKNKVKFDKQDMPERYQYQWADDVTQPFNGDAIQILSPTAQQGNIEEVSLSDFNSDVDFMLLNPASASEDGFALLAATFGNAVIDDNGGSYPLSPYSEGTNGYTQPFYNVDEVFAGYTAKLDVETTGSGSYMATVLDANSNILYQSASYSAGTRVQIEVPIYATAKYITFAVVGSMRVVLHAASVENLLELPFIRSEIGGTALLLQNGYAAMTYLQPTFLTYDMPASFIKVNGTETYAHSVSRNKLQEVKLPNILQPQLMKTIKTQVGSGNIREFNLNLDSLTADVTLEYATE